MCAMLSAFLMNCVGFGITMALTFQPVYWIGVTSAELQKRQYPNSFESVSLWS